MPSPRVLQIGAGPVLSALVVFVILFVVYGCGGGGSQSAPPPPPVQNPVPSISSLSPSSAMAGAASQALTINGTNFLSISTVTYNGVAHTASFVSSTQLNITLSASDQATAGAYPVIVTNPAPGGGTSNTVNFTITSGTNPIPTITGLSPSVTAVGGPAFTLTVSGSNFVASSVVRWNGTDRPTAFQNSTQVTAQIPAGDIAATGTAAITVFNPVPGGGTSNSLNFSIVTGLRPLSVAVAPDPSGKFGKFAYVANFNSNNVSMYTINPATGILEAVGIIATGTGPFSVAVHPSGKFAYVANLNSNNVSMYTIDTTTGALNSIGTIGAGTEPDSVVVHPSGKFAYVANFGDEDFGSVPGSVSMYGINADGGLASIGTIAEALVGTTSVAVHPSGKFAYVANSDFSHSNTISMYTIDATTGALTSIGKVAGDNPGHVAVHPSGSFAYVANVGSSNTISMYTVDPTTGALTSIGTVAAGRLPESVAVDPSGKFAYTANAESNDVSMYTVNATTGALTSIGTIAAGLAPNSIAIDPSGKFAYVANAGSNNISMYSIDAATGALTLIGTIGT
jgi:YVTN family beta-propeller protein